MTAGIYTRLSEEDRNKQHPEQDSQSIQNQKNMLLQYAFSQGWDVYDIYNDDDYAGADRKRPEFNRLLKDAQAGKFHIVLCKTQSRFTREMELVEKYIHGLFPIWGIRFVSIVDNADTDVKGNKKARQINGLVNEWYLEDLSENIKSVLTNRRENGLYTGAFAPYGYKKDPEDKSKLIIDWAAAAIVKEIYQQYLSGCGITHIARILNSRGIPNPSAYKLQEGLRYRSSHKYASSIWKYATVSAILSNEVYIGNLVQGKTASISYKTKQLKQQPEELWIRAEHTHAPIIDPSVWERVQKLRKGKSRPLSEGVLSPFAHKVICGHCGSVMRSQKNGSARSLCCSSRFYAKDACIGSYIGYSTLERMVRRELCSLSGRYMDLEEISEKVEFHNDKISQKVRLEQENDHFEKNRQVYSKGLRTLYLDKVRGAISEEDYQSMAEGFLADQKQLEDKIAANHRLLAQLQTQLEQNVSKREMAERYVSVTHLTRSMVLTLIDRIVLYKRVNGEREPRMEIFWNF